MTEEKLVTQKHQEQTGAVEVRKTVVEEMDLRRDLITRDPRTPWEKVKDAVRDVWDRAHTGI